MIPKFCKFCLKRLDVAMTDVCASPDCLGLERSRLRVGSETSKERLISLLEDDVEQFEMTPMVGLLSQLGSLAKKVRASPYDDCSWAIREREAVLNALKRASEAPPKRERELMFERIVPPLGEASIEHLPQFDFQFKKLVLHADVSGKFAMTDAQALEKIEIVGFRIGADEKLGATFDGRPATLPAALFSELAIGACFSAEVRMGTKWGMHFRNVAAIPIRLFAMFIIDITDMP